MKVTDYPQKVIYNIGKNSCLMMCYMFCMGVETDTKTYFQYCLDAVNAGEDKSGISSDCTVVNPEKFILWFSGRRVKVEKKVGCSLSHITGPYPVKFIARGYTPHFVVVENGKVVFDPLQTSCSVQYGKPESIRVITLRKDL